MAIPTYLLIIGELGVEKELLASAVFVKPQISRVCKFKPGRAFSIVGPKIRHHQASSISSPEPNSSKVSRFSPLLALLKPH